MVPKEGLKILCETSLKERYVAAHDDFSSRLEVALPKRPAVLHLREADISVQYEPC